MTTTTKETKGIPARLAFIDGKPGEYTIKGAPGTHGDAGWTIVNVRVEDVAAFLVTYQAARMPCWARFDANGNVVR